MQDLTGKASFAQKHRAAPRFSFSKASTYRTIHVPKPVLDDGVYPLASYDGRTEPAGLLEQVSPRSGRASHRYLNADVVLSSAVNCRYGQYTDAPGQSDKKIFYATSSCISQPGAADYRNEIAKNSLLRKSPRATIGREARFSQDRLMGEVRAKVPVSYVEDAAKVLSPKAKMGAIGRQVRFTKNKYNNGMPGVGTYTLEHLTCMSKASQSSFDSRAALFSKCHQPSKSKMSQG